MRLSAIFAFLSLFIFSPIYCHNSPFVTAYLQGQLGNNLFQVATASALAWDNQAEPCFDFDIKSAVFRHVFFRCKNRLPRHISFEWKEPSYAYHPIPYYPDMRIRGYFQSEKHFAHHRNRLLQLFAPRPKDLAYMETKYRWLLKHPNTVGVQIRYYKWEFPTGDMYPQYGKEYLEEAMALFPKSTLFVVSSNNLDFARKAIPTWAKNVTFLENEPHYIDFYLLSFCKHNIITNSSFGWWSAWLNQNPDKIVVRPAIWVNGLPNEDICPEHWHVIDAIYH